MRRAETAAFEFQPVEAFRPRLAESHGSSGTARHRCGGAGTSLAKATSRRCPRLRDLLLAAGQVRQLKSLDERERAAVLPGTVIPIAAFEALEDRTAGGRRRRVARGSALRSARTHPPRMRTHDRRLCARYQWIAPRPNVQHRADCSLTAETWGWTRRRVAPIGRRGCTRSDRDRAQQVSPPWAYLVQHLTCRAFLAGKRLLAASSVVTAGAFPKRFGERRGRHARAPAGGAARLVAAATRHAEMELPAFRLKAGKRTLRLYFPRGWLARHRSRRGFEREAGYLRQAGCGVRLIRLFRQFLQHALCADAAAGRRV